MDSKRRSTGYYDCNGREIHEGDIVQVGNLEGAVTYDERLDLHVFLWHTSLRVDEHEDTGRNRDYRANRGAGRLR